jgi:hypothetical protein
VNRTRDTHAHSVRAAARYLAALLLIGIGVIHLYENIHNHYAVIPIIGTLFYVNFAGALALALALVAPVDRVPAIGGPLLRLLMLAVAGFAAAAIGGLLISENSTLFGFHEQGYRTNIDLSLGLEGALILLAGLFLALDVRRHPPESVAAPHAGSPRRTHEPGLPAQGHGPSG